MFRRKPFSRYLEMIVSCLPVFYEYLVNASFFLKMKFHRISHFRSKISQDNKHSRPQCHIGTIVSLVVIK